MTTTKRKHKHTPGPWHAVGYWVEVESDDVADICTCNPADISLERLGRKDDEICANAALIAAAPDLLDALSSFLRAPSVGSNGPASITIVVQDFNMRAARAAIAKATGAA